VVLALFVGWVSLACAPIRQRVEAGRGDAGTEAETEAPREAVGSPEEGPPAAAERPWEAELEGLASWYGEDFNGRLTASGEVYDMYAMTAAHKTLPLQTVVRVEDLETGKSIEVRVNDRGPYVKGRVIDLSRKAARALGMRDQGVVRVRLHVLRMPDGR
jgi:rare lipoprotein A